MSAKQVFISVAETSADMHAAALVLTARERLPECTFHGLTGPRLRELGVLSIGDLTRHAAMLDSAAGLLGRAMEMRRRVEESWRARRPDLVILLDSPEFHLNIGPLADGLAPMARRMGLKVLYYIAPQTWASRAGRNRNIAASVEKLACILPFEEAYFRRHGIDAEYVGHPLFETLARRQPDPAAVKRLRGDARHFIAILPGSRAHVIEAMLPLQLEVLRKLESGGRVQGPIAAGVSVASPDHQPRIGSAIEAAENTARLRITATFDNAALLAAADLVLVASGTATLEVGYYRKLMIVMYDVGGPLRILHPLLGSRLVKTPHLSLLNILARARIVPEFMPIVPRDDSIPHIAAQLLDDEVWRQLMTRQIDEIVAPLAQPGASRRVCDIIRRMLGVQDRPKPPADITSPGTPPAPEYQTR